MNILESRIGGFDLSIIDEEIQTGFPDYRGPVNLILPNINFDFTFELSRPLQSFGIMKMFNDGFQRKDYDENLITRHAWHFAAFNSRFLSTTFFDEMLSTATTDMNVVCDHPFFFSLRNTESDVIQLFGLVKDHESFNQTEFSNWEFVLYLQSPMLANDPQTTFESSYFQYF